MKYQYEAALSFAGEDKVFAEAVAKSLRQESVQIFYDNFLHFGIVGRRSLSKVA
jgi:hypothetical protein